jgi:hypothetical protein
MRKVYLFVLLMAMFGYLFGQGAEFSNSLHKTRFGKFYWYAADTDSSGAPVAGFESLTEVPIDSMGCIQCHGPADANGDPYDDDYEPTCTDCHKSDFSVEADQCYSCHGRQKAEAIAMGLPDVHREAGMVCWDCHRGSEEYGTDDIADFDDIHGDGNEYPSMLADGAMKADCENCHTELPGSHVSNDPHGGKLHCVSCHASTVISCYNCHLDSQLEHNKRARTKIKDFILLVNREKDNKVYTASFQSITHDSSDESTWIAYGPYTPHSIIKEGRDCDACHGTDVIEEYYNDGQIKFASYDNGEQALTVKKGVVPLPHDYDQTFKMDFITYKGLPSDPLPGDGGWETIGKDLPDGNQLFFASGLTADQLASLRREVTEIDTNFATSLHKTRAGKATWYNADDGFYQFTEIPLSELGCVECHGGPNDANGDPWPDDYEPSCVDCHATKTDWSTSKDQCLNCHGRQKSEIGMGFSDVHRDAGMECQDCHGSEDMHGDGTEYASFLEEGAIKTNCEQCHPNTPAGHEDYDPHDGKLHCTTCHAQSVISCYNCHFESQLEHVKRARTKIRDFMLLVNREKDGKVHPAAFQSLTYQDTAFVAYGPYTPHNITSTGRQCDDCHANEHITEYMANGELKFVTFDEDTDTLAVLKGVVPIPVDYATTFKMDFITYDGNADDPLPGDGGWSSIGKDVPDGQHMLYATPLSEHQLEMLSLDFGSISETFETSLHNTRAGKNYWYSKDQDPPGFEKWTNVPITDIGCVECHGPTKADGTPNGDDYEPGCDDCHGVNGAVSQDQCLSCHGRQKSEIGAGDSDVHRDAGFVCWDCHSQEEMHGDGNAYNSMLEPGAIATDCEDCHVDYEHEGTSNDFMINSHLEELHCTACHSQTATTCYNCHFESQLEHNKRAFTKVRGFTMLVNREKDGKVGTAAFQSLTYQGNKFVAFGPYTSHNTTVENAKDCDDCHNNAVIQEYNSSHTIQFATWNPEDSTLSTISGVIPMPFDYEETFKMDFLTYNGNTTDPVAPSKNWSVVPGDWDGHQMFFASPLTKAQMYALGYDTTLVSVNNETNVPTDFALRQNYPNPFNPSTTIAFNLPRHSEIVLKVFNVLGKEVAVLYNGQALPAGNHEVTFEAGNLASGIYFYQIRTAGFVKTRKMFLMK